ncbi:MAG: hypothetical protein A2W33_05385 [Chloroflexi bacterium RBG_16_52_11]|nr:MAG: hypothetical protein A2W33_05385 [Chloroflexi bacterium RBG_16_52_11]
MSFEDMEPEGQEFELEEQEAAPPEESSNRTFIIVAGILGGITLLALLCIAVYAFFILPSQRNQDEQKLAEINAQNTQVAQALTQTATVKQFTPTRTATAIPPTATRTPTAVIAVPTNTVVVTMDPRTATVAALLTQAAQVSTTVMPTSTALPATGFAEDVGIPGMLGLAVLLIAIFFLARRLRTTS